MGDVGGRQAVGSAWNAARSSLAASPGFSILVSPQTAQCTLVNRLLLPRRRRQTLAKLRVRRGLNQLRETGISSHAHPDTAGSPSPAKLAKRKTTSWVQAVQAATFPHAKISGACLQTRAGLVRVRGKLWETGEASRCFLIRYKRSLNHPSLDVDGPFCCTCTQTSDKPTSHTTDSTPKRRVSSPSLGSLCRECPSISGLVFPEFPLCLRGGGPGAAPSR